MSVTKMILGHWWNDKLLCLGAAVFQLERASESPGGLATRQAAGPAPRVSDWGGGGLGGVRGMPMPLLWGPLLEWSMGVLCLKMTTALPAS